LSSRRVTPADATAAVCAGLLGLVGAAFVLKYGARVVPGLAGPLAGAFVVGYVGVLAALRAWARRRPGAAAWGARAALGVLLLAGVAAALLGPDESRVARAPAVAAWLDALAAGHFPYCLPIRPSALPGLFYLLAPLHALGALAWGPAAGLALFAALAWRLVPAASDRLVVFTALVGLPALHYEGLVQSELFLNAALALAAVALAEKARTAEGAGWVWAAGALAGVAAATRMVVPLVLALYLAFAFRRAPRRSLGAAALAAVVFAALVAPFVLWDAARFFGCGPLAVQGLYLPAAVPALALPAALALGGTARDLRAVVVRAGVLLSALVAFAFAWKAAAVGLADAVWGDGFDISYFALGTPFLALALRLRAAEDAPSEAGGA
jgi:hypothetical protein